MGSIGRSWENCKFQCSEHRLKTLRNKEISAEFTHKKTSTPMKPSLPKPFRLRRCGKLAVLALAVLTAHGSIIAQENVVALGRVDATGALTSSSNTVGGIVASARNATGSYTVTVTAVGAFTGTDVNDFAGQATINSSGSGDSTVKVAVSAVTTDVITLEVTVDDVEDATNADLQVAVDAAFNFVLFRIPTTVTASTTTSHLIASGKVGLTGLLQSSIGRDGIAVTSGLVAAGDFNIALTKPGRFLTDTMNDYVILLTLEGSGAEAYAIRGDVTDVTAGGQVVIKVRTDDVQAAVSASAGVPLSRGFYFSVFQTTTQPAGTVDTEALVAHARVGTAGALLTNSNSFDGGVIASTQLGVGLYRVTVTSTGAFAGRTAAEFVAQATLNQNVSSDEGIAVEVIKVNDNTLQVDVSVNDLEVAGEAGGVLADAGFYLSILDTFSVSDRIRPDLLIGKRRALTKMTGDNVYGRNGRGQSIRLDLVKLKWSRYFFALENDGNVTDRVRIKETGRVGKMKTKYFRLTGGRTNITGQMTRAGYIEASLLPDAVVRYQGRVKYRSPRNRPKQSIRILARSLVDTSKVDAVRVKASGEFRAGHSGGGRGE